MEIEEWKDIPGYEGKYQASSFGRIRSLSRTVVAKNGRRQEVVGSLLHPGLRKDGYLKLNLTENGKHRAWLVHRLVLLTFSGPPAAPNMGTRHFPDRTKHNNHITNLSWGTQQENAADTLVHGTAGQGRNSSALYKRRLDEVGKSKPMSAHRRSQMTETAKACGIAWTNCTEEMVREIRALYATGVWSRRQLALKFQISTSNVQSIVTRKTWNYL